ncbi:MAG: hypothetical protein C5B55_09760 [Blastocatellia bacterium]|nr:MAG: hypothetical protein C5B55_09760 [Blastocatellia bacterium]
MLLAGKKLTAQSGSYWVFRWLPLFVPLIAITVAAQTPTKARLPDSPIKTVYIIPTSHYDFGFVEPPDQVRERAARHIDEVIRVAESDPDFRWTIESVWQVNEWLKRQKPATSVLPKDNAKIARLVALIKSGRIALSTAWGSMHTDFMGAEELNRMCYDYTVLKRTYGVESQLALMDDVPGHPTSIPSVLANSGTKYLVTGANTFLASATTLAPGKVPFYWQSPDGSKVLIWISQGKRGGYVEGMTDFYLDPYSLDPYTNKTPYEMFNPNAGPKTDLQKMEEGVTELLNRYNAGGYKYDSVMVMFAHDFVEPTNVRSLEKAVKLWNINHPEIQLKIATPPEFFKAMESKYQSEIPTYRGEWSGLWSEAKTQSPLISALARFAHEQTPAAETLWSGLSMTRSIPYPVGNMASLYDWMFTYDEHSGAGNTGWIQLNDRLPLEEQNRQYVRYMKQAESEVENLFSRGLALLAQASRYDEPFKQTSANEWNMVVYNGLSWQRNDVVEIQSPREDLRVASLTDNVSKQPVAFDIDEKGNVLFVAKGVPALGYKTFTVTTAPGKAETTLTTVSGSVEASNANYRIKVRPDGNIQSIYDLRLQREIVNDKGELPFNDLLRVEGSTASRLSTPITPIITIKKGRQLTEISVMRPRAAFSATVIRLYDGLDRAEISNLIDGSRLPFPGGSNNWSDSYYFSFPFSISKDNLKIMRGGQKWFDTLPDDYLPGARQDSVTTQHLIGLTDGNATAMLAHRQTFHFAYAGFVNSKLLPKGSPQEFPAMYTGKFPLPEATIYSRALRHTEQADTHDLGVVNMATVEPGLGDRNVFDYAIRAGGKWDTVTAWRFGAEFNLRLRAVYVGTPPGAPDRSFFNVDQPNVQIVSIKPLSDTVVHGEVSATPLDPQLNKLYTIRLHEFAGRATEVRINLPVPVKQATRMNLTEDIELEKIGSVSPLTVRLDPFATATIRIEIDRGK